MFQFLMLKTRWFQRQIHKNHQLCSFPPETIGPQNLHVKNETLESYQTCPSGGFCIYKHFFKFRVEAPLQWVSFARLYTTASWKELLALVMCSVGSRLVPPEKPGKSARFFVAPESSGLDQCVSPHPLPLSRQFWSYVTLEIVQKT